MQPPSLLWLGLATAKEPTGLTQRLAQYCQIFECQEAQHLGSQIAEQAPNVICFDFDTPDKAELVLLQKTKLLYPSIPILMFVETCSVELLIWALRSRVWDCFIKPVSTGEVMRRLNIIQPVLQPHTGQRARAVLMPQRTPYSSKLPRSVLPPERISDRAAEYLRCHYQERVTLNEMAMLCDMNIFEFSRAFKREQGLTFRDYILHLRIQAAAWQLLNSRDNVIDIAYDVGFNDPSHFSRQFRRGMGLTPSAYRRRATAARANYF